MITKNLEITINYVCIMVVVKHFKDTPPLFEFKYKNVYTIFTCIN